MWRRLPGPAGSLALHGALVALIFHFQVLNEVFGRRPAEPMDWTSLSEVTLVEVPPEPPPPEPPVEPVPEPEPEVVIPPEPEPEPEEEPVKEWAEPLPEPEVEESPVVVPEALPPKREVQVAQEPVPPPPPVVAEVAPSRQHDAWVEVRAGIMRELRYPARARQGRIEGVVVVVLSLDEAGGVIAAEIREPSPGVVLSEAVMRAVRRAGPFPEAGKAIRRGEMPATAEISIRFELRRAGF